MLICWSLAADPSHADWPASSAANLAICTATNNQNIPAIVTDRAGGVIVAWTDGRGGGRDIYVQRVSANGVPEWAVNGLAVCGTMGDQTNSAIVSDGAGGAVVVWQDSRSGTPDIYAHHVLASGALDPTWPPTGLPIAAIADSQTTPVALEDGTGGAFIAWQDKRNGTHSDIYAHHVLSNGELDPGWPELGRLLCGAIGNQQRPRLASDGLGGAIVIWSDQRAGTGSDDVYANRVALTGAIGAGWPADGVMVCGAAGVQQFPVVLSDGSGGAVISWADSRSGDTGFDIYAHHLLANGSVDGSWPTDGRAVCTEVGLQQNPMMSEDGDHGVIVAWQDARSGVSDIYAHRVRSDGTLDPAWTGNGVLLCGATNSQAIGAIVPDGTGGAIVTWTDFRNSSVNPDVYAQHVAGSGVVDPAWTINGAAISTAANSQASPKAIPDGAGGAILVWTDARNGATNSDIYGQRVQAGGQLGGDVVGVPRADRSLALAKVFPNPVRGKVLTIAFSLPDDGPGVIELIDITGRRLRMMPVHGITGSLRLPTQELRPGFYFVRLAHGADSRWQRIAILGGD